MSPRSIALLSLALLAAYVGVVGVAGEPFPLGGPLPDAGRVGQALAVVLGLALGWAIPGLALSALASPTVTGFDRLPRAFGLGTGYLIAAGLAHALVMGRAPGRLTWLILLALPPLVLALRRPATAQAPRTPVNILVAPLAAMAVVTMLAWPLVSAEGMNGDGSEVYELVRSLDDHPRPYWDLEDPNAGGRFGTPVTVPYLTGAYFAHSVMTVVGRGEVALRLVFVSSVVMAAFVALAFAPIRDRSAWAYTTALLAVSVLWAGYYLSYEAPFEIAEPAGTGLLTMTMFLAAAWELQRGAVWAGVVGAGLASGTTYAGPLLSALAFIALRWQDQAGARRVWPWVAGVGGGSVIALAVVGWQTGDWPYWFSQVHSEYWLDLVAPERRVASLPLFGYFLLCTGVLPVVVWWRWSRLSGSSRLLVFTGTAYLAIALAGSYKMLHYLTPLAWLFLAPVIEVTSARLRWAGTAALVAVFLASWPSDPGVRADTIALGRDSCVRYVDYQDAVVGADAIYAAFEQPLASDRYAVGKHTFVRYGLALGGNRCAIGVSPTMPDGVVPLVDGPAAVWTTDIDRYVFWRFFPWSWATSPLFPRPALQHYASRATGWSMPVRLNAEPGHALIVTGSTRVGPDGVALLSPRARLLVPVTFAEGGAGVRIHLRESDGRRVHVRINGGEVRPVDTPADGQEWIITGTWRRGWNVLQLDGVEGLVLRALDGSGQ